MTTRCFDYFHPRRSVATLMLRQFLEDSVQVISGEEFDYYVSPWHGTHVDYEMRDMRCMAIC